MVARFLIPVVFGFLATLAGPAWAGLVLDDCKSTAGMDSLLRMKYGERPFAQGMTLSEQAAAVYVNAETGTWTILILFPQADSACILAAGDGWSSLPPVLPGEAL